MCVWGGGDALQEREEGGCAWFRARCLGKLGSSEAQGIRAARKPRLGPLPGALSSALPLRRHAGGSQMGVTIFLTGLFYERFAVRFPFDDLSWVPPARNTGSRCLGKAGAWGEFPHLWRFSVKGDKEPTGWEEIGGKGLSARCPCVTHGSRLTRTLEASLPRSCLSGAVLKRWPRSLSDVSTGSHQGRLAARSGCAGHR